jgi:hypothetical protein
MSWESNNVPKSEQRRKTHALMGRSILFRADEPRRQATKIELRRPSPKHDARIDAAEPEPIAKGTFYSDRARDWTDEIQARYRRVGDFQIERWRRDLIAQSRGRED